MPNVPYALTHFLMRWNYKTLLAAWQLQEPFDSSQSIFQTWIISYKLPVRGWTRIFRKHFHAGLSGHGAPLWEAGQSAVSDSAHSLLQWVYSNVHHRQKFLRCIDGDNPALNDDCPEPLRSTHVPAPYQTQATYQALEPLQYPSGSLGFRRWLI